MTTIGCIVHKLMTTSNNNHCQHYSQRQTNRPPKLQTTNSLLFRVVLVNTIRPKTGSIFLSLTMITDGQQTFLLGWSFFLSILPSSFGLFFPVEFSMFLIGILQRNMLSQTFDKQIFLLLFSKTFGWTYSFEVSCWF